MIQTEVEKLTLTKFKIANLEKIDGKIVYSTDDLIIKDGISYLDLRNSTCNENQYSEYYLFSEKFTLGEVDDLISIMRS